MNQHHDSLEGIDDHLAEKAQIARERALVTALAASLKIVEVVNLSAAIRIVDQLCAAVLPLPGEPIVLDECWPAPLVPLIEVEECDVALRTVAEFLKEQDGRS
jgi:hypothetical protein